MRTVVGLAVVILAAACLATQALGQTGVSLYFTIMKMIHQSFPERMQIAYRFSEMFDQLKATSCS